VIAGLSLEKYLTFIEFELLNDEEFKYIKERVEGLQGALEKIHQALLLEYPPESSVLEKLESLQAERRGRRFSGGKKN